MKTTELFVDQVLIGGLVLLVVGLLCPGFPPEGLFGARGDLLAQLAAAGLLVGIAYLVGIVYDRVADSLLVDLERRARLEYVLNRVGQEVADPGRGLEGDPFPESELRISVLRCAPAASYERYLRSRVRLTRSLCTLLPALALAASLRVLDVSRLNHRLWIVGVVTLGTTYGIVLCLKLVKPRKLGMGRALRGYEPPRTDQLANVETYMAMTGRIPTGQEPGRSVWWFWWQERLYAGLVLLTLAGCLLGTLAAQPTMVGLVLLGFVLTLLVGWCWRRILETYFAFLDDFRRHYPAGQ